jgi:dCTP deaminase
VFTKSSLGRVFINHMMAGVIDAGFEGTITLELKNEGKHSIILPYGARVVQIQFNRLEMIPERDYSQRINRYQGQIQPEPAREERL